MTTLENGWAVSITGDPMPALWPMLIRMWSFVHQDMFVMVLFVIADLEISIHNRRNELITYSFNRTPSSKANE